MSGYAYAAMAGLQLVGGYFASQNIKETAKLNREISDMNAEFAELDAYDALAQGGTDMASYQAQIDNTLAEQSTMMHAQDIDVNYGSAASVASETKFVGQLNLMEIQKQAQNKALGFKRQARDIRLGGALQQSADHTRAGQAMLSGVTSAAKTGMTGYAKSGALKYDGPTGSVDRAGGKTQYSSDYMDME
jgi:hypothetical protein